MRGQALELILARLYTDPDFRSRFLHNAGELPELKALEPADFESLLKIDKAGLLMASHSFLHKRKQKHKSKPPKA